MGTFTQNKSTKHRRYLSSFRELFGLFSHYELVDNSATTLDDLLSKASSVESKHRRKYVSVVRHNYKSVFVHRFYTSSGLIMRHHSLLQTFNCGCGTARTHSLQLPWRRVHEVLRGHRLHKRLAKLLEDFKSVSIKFNALPFIPSISHRQTLTTNTC